jgi:recombination protein RecA
MCLAALRGRLSELSARGASGTLTTAIAIVREAQEQAEPVAWIALAGAPMFYPPDAAATGIDLAALAVVRAPDLDAAARAAEGLLRSGAFGLVVLDLASAGDRAKISAAHLGRMITLAQTHDAAVLCITAKPADAPSVGSLISLRAEALRLVEPGQPGRFSVRVRVLKDKRRGPGAQRLLKVRGPDGY